MLDYIATGKVDPERIATVVAGVHEGCRLGRLRPHRRRNGRAPRGHGPRRARPRRVRVGVVERRDPARARAGPAGRRGHRPCRLRACAPTATPWPAMCCSSSPGSTSATRPGTARRPRWPTSCCGRPSSTRRPCLPPARRPGRRSTRAAHITGGGIVGNVPRVLPDGVGAVLRRASWEEPRIFEEIRRLGAVDEDEMDRVFNRGIGMALVVDVGRVDDVLSVLDAAERPGARHRRGRRPDRACASHEWERRLPQLRAHLLEHSVKTGDFTLKSGRKSSWFIDSKQTVCRPEAMLLVADAVLSVVPPVATAIGGLTMGADPVAFVTAGVAASRGRAAQGIQRAQGGQGPRGGGRIAGALDPGDKVVVTEDTVTRGTSLLEAAARGAGGRGRGRAPGGARRSGRHRRGDGRRRGTSGSAPSSPRPISGLPTRGPESPNRGVRHTSGENSGQGPVHQQARPARRRGSRGPYPRSPRSGRPGSVPPSGARRSGR